MGLEVVTKDQQRLFLDGVEVRGLQSVQIQSAVNVAPLKFLGLNKSRTIPDGAQAGRISMSSLFVTDDQIIHLTGENSVDGFVFKDETMVNDNIGWTKGYLSSYNCNCSIGNIPTIDANFTVLGNMGRIEYEESSGNFDIIPTSIKSGLKIVGPGSISITANGFNTNRIISSNVNLSINRIPHYRLGDKYPYEVKINWPIEVTCDFLISQKDYEPFPMKKYPSLSKKTDITIDIKELDSKENILSYDFKNMELVSENYSMGINKKGEITLQYKGYMYPYSPEYIYFNSQEEYFSNTGVFLNQ